MHGLANKPWTYMTYAPDTAPGAFGPFASFIRLWNRKRRSLARMPAWSDYDFYEFQDWWGRVSLAEVRRQPLDIHFILWGTHLTDWWGTDYTRKSLAKKPIKPNVWDENEQRFFQHFVTQPSIGYSEGPLDAYGRGFYLVRGIDLPLMTDGVITHILSAYDKAAEEDGEDKTDEAAWIRPTAEPSASF